MNARAPVLRRRRESGNAMVEGAFVFLPFFALIFGIMDFSMVLFITGLFQDAARDASRYVSEYNMTYNGTTYTSQTSVAKAIMYAETLGFITSANDTANDYVHVNYYFPNDLTTPATCATACAYTWTDSNGNSATVNYENQPGDVVEIRVVGFSWNWMAPLPNYMPGTGLTLSADAVDVLQGLPSTMSTPPTP